MGGQDKKRTPDLDQPPDHGKGALHRILDIRALEQLVDEYQPFLLVADLLEGVTDALDLIEEKALAFGDIVLYIDIAQDAVEDGEPHRLRRNTHAQMRQKNDGPYTSDERTLPRHIGPGEKHEIGFLVQPDIVRHGTGQ